MVTVAATGCPSCFIVRFPLKTVMPLIVKAVLPPLLGAAGAVAATMAPAYYKAVCGGMVLPGISFPLGG